MSGVLVSSSVTPAASPAAHEALKDAGIQRHSEIEAAIEFPNGTAAFVLSAAALEKFRKAMIERGATAYELLRGAAPSGNLAQALDAVLKMEDTCHLYIEKLHRREVSFSVTLAPSPAGAGREIFFSTADQGWECLMAKVRQSPKGLAKAFDQVVLEAINQHGFTPEMMAALFGAENLKGEPAGRPSRPARIERRFGHGSSALDE